MADMTTNLIRDTFLANRPSDMSETEATRLWETWLDQHHFEPLTPPEPPTGTEYAIRGARRMSEESRDEIGWLYDEISQIIEHLEVMKNEGDEGQAGELLRQARVDLAHAENHLERALKLEGWKPLPDED